MRPIILSHNVADPGCISRILILSILDPGPKKRGREKICSPTFFCFHKYIKLKIILVLNLFFFEKKLIQLQKNKAPVFFTQKIVPKLSEIWVCDLGVKKAPGYESAILLLLYS
jgi:hypothetical protein